MRTSEFPITVCIPTIPPRADMLLRAVESVTDQTLPAAAISIAVDTEKEGAPATRDRALAAVDTPYVAFLDDDDRLLSQHLSKLAYEMERTEADVVYPWFKVVGGTDPFPNKKFKEWDSEHPHVFPVTFLASTTVIRLVGGFSRDWAEDGMMDEEGQRAGEDYRLILRLVELGAKIVHLPEVTWQWFHNLAKPKGIRNTSGRPSGW